MKKIPLNHGKFAMVDDEDFERVAQFRWQYRKTKSGAEYVIRKQKINGVYVNIHLHRFVLPHDFQDTDHIDGNGLNNQKFNLRPCTRSQNKMNQHSIRLHSSRFKGVHFKKSSNIWGASIRARGKLKHLGYTEDESDAAKLYDVAANKLFGEFARTNKMLGLLP